MRTTESRWWALALDGPRVVLPVTLYEHDEFPSAPKVIAYHVAVHKREVAELKRLLAKRAGTLTVPC